MSDGLHLYVWRNVFSDYTAGVAFALAHDEHEARHLIFSAMGDTGYPEYHANPDADKWEWPYEQLAADPEVHDEPFGFQLYGGG